MAWRARGELVQHALLVGLGVQQRRHFEERVEAQQHLREYSEYHRPQAPANQRRPNKEYGEYGRVGLLSAYSVGCSAPRPPR